jgi:hypothetical protein
LDADELLVHLRSAANACDPLPFYVYEFAGRSGYSIPGRGDRDACAAGAERASGVGSLPDSTR